MCLQLQKVSRQKILDKSSDVQLCVDKRKITPTKGQMELFIGLEEYFWKTSVLMSGPSPKHEMKTLTL